MHALSRCTHSVMDPTRCRLCHQEKAILFNWSPIPKEEYKHTIFYSLQKYVLKDDNTKAPFICIHVVDLALDHWNKNYTKVTKRNKQTLR